MILTYSLNEFRNEIWWENKGIALIGRSPSGNSKFLGWKYNHHSTNVFCMNDTRINYMDCEFTIILESHFKDWFDSPILENQKIAVIKSAEIYGHRKLNLVTGCTPSLFLSYLLRYVDKYKPIIYLQGFGMDETHNSTTKQIYEWEHQFKAFSEVRNIAIKNGIELRLVTHSERLEKIINYKLPDSIDIIKN